MTKIGRIEIDMKGPVAGGNKGDTITLDGIPIQNCIRSIAIPRASVGELLTVELDVIAMPGLRFAGSAYIGLPPNTADLLIAMGWTPPDGSNRLINDLGYAFQTHVMEHKLDHVNGGARTDTDVFHRCTLPPCADLPTTEREAMRIDTHGRVITRHPIAPAAATKSGPDTTPVDGAA